MILARKVLLSVGKPGFRGEPLVKIVVAIDERDPNRQHLRIVVTPDAAFEEGAKLSTPELAALAAGIQRILEERKGNP